MVEGEEACKTKPSTHLVHVASKWGISGFVRSLGFLEDKHRVKINAWHLLSCGRQRGSGIRIGEGGSRDRSRGLSLKRLRRT